MGYNVQNSKSSFLISKDNLPHALDALRALPDWEDADLEEPSHVFQVFGLDITEDDDGNVADLFLATERLGDTEVAAFHAVAPFVADGSYVMFIGEDSAQWAWTFRKNAETGAVEAAEDGVIPVLASEYQRLTAPSVPS
jgi:hypothetical protein